MEQRERPTRDKRRLPRVRTYAWWRDLTYRWTQNAIRLMGIAFWRLRVHHPENWPRAGGALLCSNHQSYLDPALIGSCCRRRMNFLARRTLFDIWLLGSLIRWYESIPLERDGLGIGGIKESLKRLQGGELVLIFPEGTRSSDGNPQPVHPGFVALARRGRVPIVPLGIDGAFDVWSRHCKFPNLASISIVVGDPISTETIRESSDDQLVAIVARRMESLFLEARQTRKSELCLAGAIPNRQQDSHPGDGIEIT